MDLVIDVGAHDGTDTDAYLKLGYRVVSIEADPVKADALKDLFAEQIRSGQCQIVQCGVGDKAGVLPFYRCAEDAGSSSFKRELAGPSPEVIEVQVQPLRNVLEAFERPFYIKCDIEGYDYEALSTLTPEYVPDFISAEIQDRPELMDLFVAFGYTKFKIITQPYNTSSEEIYTRDYGWRALRKASRILPGLRALISALPQSWRPKTEWEVPRSAVASGHFGEQAFGAWLTEASARAKLGRIMRHAKDTAGGRAWVDLHAGGLRAK